MPNELKEHPYGQRPLSRPFKERRRNAERVEETFRAVTAQLSLPFKGRVGVGMGSDRCPEAANKNGVPGPRLHCMSVYPGEASPHSFALLL